MVPNNLVIETSFEAVEIQEFIQPDTHDIIGKQLASSSF